MVVDPDDIVRSLISYVLTRAGYVVEAGSDPGDLLSPSDHDVMVLDAAIVMNGAPHFRDPDRVVLTTKRGLRNPPEVFATIQKPIDFAALIDTVRDCLKQGG